MAPAPVSAHIVLIVTAATLFYVARTDLKEFKIRNELVLCLAGLYVLFAVLSGRWVGIPWNIGFAIFMLIVMLYYYSQGMMGGGDVKLLAVAFLWVGIECALVFAIFLTISIVIHLVVVKFGWARVQEHRGRKRIPFAPSIAAALIISFMSGCLEPEPWRFAFWPGTAQTDLPKLTIPNLQEQLNPSR
jgi:prepilin peptidase CpaA